MMVELGVGNGGICAYVCVGVCGWVGGWVGGCGWVMPVININSIIS